MMSTAILMAGAAQASVRSASADRGETEGISFAKSLDESVGDSALLQENKPAGEVATELEHVKGAVLAKEAASFAEVPGGARDKAQEISARAAVKGVMPEKMAQTQTVAVTVSQGRTATSDRGADQVELPAQVEKPVDDLLAAAASSHVAQVDKSADEGDVTSVSTAGVAQADVDRSWALSASEPLVGGSIEIAGKTKEADSAKDTVKPQEGAATPRIGKKAVVLAANMAAVEFKPGVGSPAEAVTPTLGQTVAIVVAPRNETGTAMKDFSTTVAVVGKPSVIGTSATVQGLVRKEIVREGKANGTDAETTLPAAVDLSAAPKSSIGPEKMALAAIPSGDGGDSRLQSASGPAAGLVHTMSGGVAASSGVGFGVVVSSGTPVEFTAAKIPTADTIAHATGLPTDSREPQEPGVVGVPMEEMPRMLMGTPTSLEVGIQNGTHGWLKVRAEMADSGVVNASVSAASPAGQEMLQRELPALTAYLQEEKVAVNAVVVHAPPPAGTDTRSSPGTDGSGGQTPQRNNAGEEQHQNFGRAILNGSNETAKHRSLHGADEDGSLPLAAFVSGGVWLSVRA